MLQLYSRNSSNFLLEMLRPFFPEHLVFSLKMYVFICHKKLDFVFEKFRLNAHNILTFFLKYSDFILVAFQLFSWNLSFSFFSSSGLNILWYFSSPVCLVCTVYCREKTYYQSEISLFRFLAAGQPSKQLLSHLFSGMFCFPEISKFSSACAATLSNRDIVGLGTYI